MPFPPLSDTLGPSPLSTRRLYNDGVTARGTVSPKHQAAIRRALAAQERADEQVREAVRAAKNDPEEPASIRELAAFLKRSPNTVRSILND